MSIINQLVEKHSAQIQMALPDTQRISPERFARIVQTEVSKNPGLLKCEPKSLFGTVIQCAQLGLEPGSAMQQVHLIPYGKQCQMVIGYRGMIQLASRAGGSISPPRAVYEGDEFEYDFGTDPYIRHKPSGQQGEMTHVYAVYTSPNGRTEFDVMTRAECDEIRSRFGGKKGPWQTDYIAMCLKTVVRRLFKYIPTTAEISMAVTLDEMADSGVAQHNEHVIEGEFDSEFDQADEPAPESVQDKVAQAASAAAPPA